MPVNHAAENVFGTLGAVCWTIQLIPQIWKSWRTKNTEGFSPWLVLIWSLSAVPLGVYVIVQNLNIPLILQPQFFGSLAMVSWAQCMYYDRKRSRRWCLTAIISILVVCGALEAGLVFAVRPSFRRGDQSGKHAVQFFGIFSSVMISLALFPQYYEIYKHRAVIGISVMFMTVDLFGGVFSVLSLVFEEHFDIIASVTYSLVVVLDGLVLLAAAILNPRARRRHRQEAETAAASESATVTVTDAPMTERTSTTVTPLHAGGDFDGDKKV